MPTSGMLEKKLPVAPLKIAYLQGSKPIAKQVNSSIVKIRKALGEKDKNLLAIDGYIEPNYL